MASASWTSIAPKVSSESSKYFPGYNQDLPRILVAFVDVEQPEQHVRTTNPQKLVKIVRHALPVIDGGNLGLAESGHVSVQWIDP
jgi:hypothetical protein